MKKMALRYSVMLAVVLGAQIPAVAQEYEYVPLVREGVKWVYCYYDTARVEEMWEDTDVIKWCHLTTEFMGDTTLFGHTYKKQYIHYQGVDYLSCFMREENKRVYAITNAENTFDDIDKSMFGVPTDDYEVTGEKLFCDFNESFDFQSFMREAWSRASIECAEEYVEIGGKLRKKRSWPWIYDEPISVIDGIGFDGRRSGRFPFTWMGFTYCVCSTTYGLSHVIGADGKIEYEGAYYKSKSLDVGVENVKAKDLVQLRVDKNHLSLSLPHKCAGMVEVVDLTGRVVKNFYAEEHAAFDLPTGTFVIRFSAPNLSKTFKVFIN